LDPEPNPNSSRSPNPNPYPNPNPNRDAQEYCGCTWHNKIELAVLMFFCGRHIGVGGAVSTWLGFFIFIGVVLALKFGLPL
jgi:hypothetical protein